MVAYKSLKTKEKSSWVIPKVVAVAYGSFLAELQGPPSGAPYSECRGKIKETHHLIFSWLSWLAVLLG